MTTEPDYHQGFQDGWGQAEAKMREHLRKRARTTRQEVERLEHWKCSEHEHLTGVFCAVIEMLDALEPNDSEDRER